jgi:hypothetical protein
MVGILSARRGIANAAAAFRRAVHRVQVLAATAPFA